jgi:hypothetical protein
LTAPAGEATRQTRLPSPTEAAVEPDFGWGDAANDVRSGGWLAAYKLAVALPLVGALKQWYDRRKGKINPTRDAGAWVRHAV